MHLMRECHLHGPKAGPCVAWCRIRLGVVALLVVASVDTAAPVSGASATAHRSMAAGQADRRCASVRARGTRWRVDIRSGQAFCVRARAVIRYVLTHGKQRQGTPGDAPRGWSCGWGYGFYRGTQYARSGPLCERGKTRIQGSAPGFTLKRAPGRAFRTRIYPRPSVSEPVSDFAHGWRVRPRSLHYRLSADTFVRLFRLHWRAWGRGTATARGLGGTCDYHGNCQTDQVRLRASRAFRPRCEEGVHARFRIYGRVTYSVRLEGRWTSFERFPVGGPSGGIYC